MSGKKNPDMGALDLSVGSTFLLDIGARYPAQAKVLSKEREHIKIKLAVPKEPKICDQCGCKSGLSKDLVTGVMKCMTTGCGKEFGYRPTITVTMGISEIFKAVKVR